VAEYLSHFRGNTSLNVAYLIPYGAVRVAVMGMAAREATSRETLRMSRLVREGLEQGAFGLSLGLNYAPMCYADRQEIVVMLQVVKEYGGFFAIHLRNYFEGLVQALQEALDLAEQTGVPVQISHLQAAGQPNWGKAELLLSMIDEARKRGIEVTLDSYPYMAGSTFLHNFLPAWSQDGGPEEILKRLTNDHFRRQILSELNATLVAWDNVIISGVASPGNQALVGSSIREIARMRNASESEAVCQLLIEEELEASFVYHHGNEQDVCRIMQHPMHMVGSDGIQSGQRPHPRLYGSFPRYLGRFVRDKELLPLETAIQKITSLPASRLGLTDRGQLKEGYAADIMVFDPLSFCDRATYEEPCQLSQGTELLIINGEIVKDSSGLREALSGQLLLRG
jgi:N-acyl-D-amino-acid deacylase